jgi:predicted glycosyltransferase
MRPRFLFYAVNGLGLGHVTRLLGLARALRVAWPRAEILFLTASEASHLIYREGFAALKVPSRVAARDGGLRHDSWLRLSQSTVWNALTTFDPHCLIVDTFAAGSTGELLPALRWPLRKVFVYRAQRHERAADAVFQSTLRQYDLILIPHTAGAETMPLPDGANAVWTGPMLLRDTGEILPRARARQALDLPTDAKIGLVSLGGGGDPDIVAARALLQTAIAQSPGTAKVLWVETSGPLDRTLHTTPEAVTPYRVLRDVHPQMLYACAFDCAVSAAGYNTTHELLASGVPTLLWPFPRDVDDQMARARRLAEQGRVLALSEGLGLNTVDESTSYGAAAHAARVAEVQRALAQLLDERTGYRLRAATKQARDNGESFNGTTAGAAAILKLFDRVPETTNAPGEEQAG